MKDLDDSEIKMKIKEISKKIDTIIQKVDDLEPERTIESEEDGNNPIP